MAGPLRRRSAGITRAGVSFSFRTFVEYKANIAGIPVAIVQPHYTRQICSRRGCLGSRWRKRFACEPCGHEADADRNAADNLRLLGMSVMHPGGPCCSLSQGNDDGLLTKPSALAVGKFTIGITTYLWTDFGGNNTKFTVENDSVL